MTTVYLHIGTHKTGTTSIQNFLSKNKKKLLDKNFLYPICGAYKKAKGHYNLAATLLKERSIYFKNMYDYRGGNWEEVKEEIDNLKPENVVISAEDLSLLQFEDIALVKKYLSAFKVKVLVYLRRQDDFFVSVYSQHIKTGSYSDSFKEFYANKKTSGDYYRRLEPWQKIFGRDNLIVRVFEPEKFKNGLLGDFLECLNLELNESKLNSFNSVNISPNIKVIKVMQFLNKIAIEGLSKSRGECQELYLKRLLKNGRIAKTISKIPDWLISNELLSAQERLEIIKEFEESNRKVAQKYLGRQDGKLFNSI